MARRTRNDNIAISTELQDTRARLAWVKKRPSLLAALAKKETFEEAKALLLRAYESMLRSRLCDQKAITLYKQNKAFFQIGAAGHEAIQVASALACDKDVDCFFPYYRDMAFCAALGMTDEEFMLNCMNKAADPNSHGRQMPMHYGAKRLNIPSQSSVVTSQLPHALGYALALKRKQKEGVVYVSCGDGACCEGDFHESLNWAGKDRLPLVFVVQNNGYSISVPLSEQLGAKGAYNLTLGYAGVKRFEVDGTDFFESYDTMQNAFAWARSGQGAALVEAHVVRLQAHSISDNQLKYKSEEEIAEEQKRCPILRLNQHLVSQRICTQGFLDEMQTELRAAVDDAAEWAEKQAEPQASEVLDHVYAPLDSRAQIEEKAPAGEALFMIDAINRTLDEEMARNPDIYVFGEDVAKDKGGVFGATAGLTRKYGNDRCFNPPLAESSIIGAAIGMALNGLMPIPEIQFGDYVWYSMLQIRNELAMMRYRSAGEWSCPLVIRIAVGGYIRGAHYHSQNIEATFAHFPGLHVIYPSNASDARGLLRAAIRGQDPVLFLEHKGLYRQVYAKGPAGDSEFMLPLGKAKVLHSGSEATIVCWGALVQKSLAAAEAYEKKGRSIEVVDLRTIVPFDAETVFKSVRKTNRVLVAHEDTMFMGFGAEVAAQIADECFQHLDAPVKRIGMKPVAAVPHAAALEEAALPQNSDVMEALEALLRY